MQETQKRLLDQQACNEQFLRVQQENVQGAWKGAAKPQDAALASDPKQAAGGTGAPQTAEDPELQAGLQNQIQAGQSRIWELFQALIDGGGLDELQNQIQAGERSAEPQPAAKTGVPAPGAHKETADLREKLADSKRQIQQVMEDMRLALSEQEETQQQQEQLIQNYLHKVNAEWEKLQSAKQELQNQLLALQTQLEQLQEETFRLEAANDDYHIRCEELVQELVDVHSQNEELTSLADEAQSLKDEMEVLRHSSDKVSKLEGTVEYYKKKLEDANHRRNGLETENRLINQRVMQGQVEELQKDLQEQALKADDSAMLEKKNQEYMDKLRELNDELLKKSAYIDDMEPKYNANTQHVDELEEALKRKEDHESMQDMNRLRATRSRASTAV
ncbi:hypothetical protein CRUP_031990 [Coryphaenoides rupestris]|nr:hypothetical protein CRUP_031990 [Coryphaenoides rupestris]